MKKAKPLFIILLIFVAMANFHIIQSDYDIPTHAEYTIQADDSQHVSSSKVLTHVYVYMRAAVSAVQSPSLAIAEALCVLVLSLYRVKSHIEYCGKKMVRAIMLQFHPRQHKCTVPRGRYFFARKKLHGVSPAPCSFSQILYFHTETKGVLKCRNSIPHHYF